MCSTDLTNLRQMYQTHSTKNLPIFKMQLEVKYLCIPDPWIKKVEMTQCVHPLANRPKNKPHIGVNYKQLERERVWKWSQPTIHLIPKCKEQQVKCKRGSSYQCSLSHPMTAPHLSNLSPCTKSTKCNESEKENKRVMWSQLPTDLCTKYKEYKVW